MNRLNREARQFVSYASLLAMMIVVLAIVGCASTPGSVSNQIYDSKAAEKAKPYLTGVLSIDFRYGETGGVCQEPKSGSDWKSYVHAAGACVQKQDWQSVEKLATEMSLRHMDSPWGAYFLGLTAAERGELLRAHWMFDLAERKAGGPIGLVRFERARVLENEEGIAAAAKEMKEAVRVEPGLLAGHLWLAQIHHRDHLLNDAEKYYRLALGIKSDLWPAVTGLADILIEKKNGQEAVELLTRAVDMRPESAEARRKLAVTYETLSNDPARALQVFRDLRLALDKGKAKGHVGFDLNQRIRTLEQLVKPQASEQAREREPAQIKKGG